MKKNLFVLSGKPNNNIYPWGPAMVESKNIYFTRRYNNTIMSFGENGVSCTYYLDFGNHWIKDRLFILLLSSLILMF